MYKCKYCNKEYISDSRLNKHIVNIHKIKPYKCKHCDRKYKTNNSLKNHLSRKHNISYKCPQCSKNFKTNAGLNHHLPCNYNIGYGCPQCDKHFKTSNGLNRHILCKHSNKRYNCKHCTKKFKLDNDLKNHLYYSHNIGTKCFDCEHCNKKFKTNSGLKNHLSYVHDKGIHQCQCCIQNVFQLTSYKDIKTQKKLKICRKCYRKMTNKHTRKEKQMSDFLDVHFGKEFLIGTDQRINHIACLKYRPDKIYASPTTILQVECDEFQHTRSGGSYQCEEKRISDIYNEFPGKQYIIIRWNPDKYKCTGPMLTRQERLKKLVTVMKNLMKIKKHPRLITVFYMFYDDDNQNIVRHLPFIHFK